VQAPVVALVRRRVWSGFSRLSSDRPGIRIRGHPILLWAIPGGLEIMRPPEGIWSTASKVIR